MRAINLRLWFVGLTIMVFIGASYQNARWLPADYDRQARVYAHEMLQMEDVSARTPSPRIIFAGGSSVIHAIDAKALERDLGVRVINMAISSRIGSDANYFDYLLPHIREGDLVIYNNNGWLHRLTQKAEAHDRREARRLANRLWDVAQIDLAERNHVDWPLFLPIPETPVFIRLSGPGEVPIRQRDDRGGLVQCPMRSVSFRPHDVPSAGPDRKVIAQISEFVRDVEARGAHVIFFETPILIAVKEREKWVHYRKKLRSQLAEVAPVLAATEPSIFRADPSSFCNSAFHVDDDFRAKWSQSLSAQLLQFPAVLALDRTGNGVAPLQLGNIAKSKHRLAD